eukprot:4725261-Ditylum_brightwellii.AAC.1
MIDNGEAEPVASVDNNIIVILLEDSLWALQHMKKIGEIFRCYPKKSKNKILTNICGVSILPYLKKQRKSS